MLLYIYIYIFSARTSSYGNVFLNIVTPTDVLHITGLEPGKIASDMKLSNIIWIIFGMYTFYVIYLYTIFNAA